MITWDEGTNNQGCCDAKPGGGDVPTVVITNNGPRGLQDGTVGNHYSMLATYQQLFGLGCSAVYNGVLTPVGFPCDTANVVPLIKLFAPSGS